MLKVKPKQLKWANDIDDDIYVPSIWLFRLFSYAHLKLGLKTERVFKMARLKRKKLHSYWLNKRKNIKQPAKCYKKSTKKKVKKKTIKHLTYEELQAYRLEKKNSVVGRRYTVYSYFPDLIPESKKAIVKKTIAPIIRKCSGVKIYTPE